MYKLYFKNLFAYKSVKGMLSARGDLLLMTDADGATKIRDVEKLETEVFSYKYLVSFFPER